MTRDRSLSAQFEHTIGVTKDGVRGLHVFARQVCISRRTSGKGIFLSKNSFISKIVFFTNTIITCI